MNCEALLRLVLLLHVTAFVWGAKRSRRDVLNDYAVKNRAQKKACQHGTCPGECDDPKGWNLRGSDWGCCSNYEGCCKLASLICYTHDVICRCCDYGFFCGPLCKKEASCFAPITTVAPATPALPQRMMGDDGRRANQIPAAADDKVEDDKSRVNPKFLGKTEGSKDKDPTDEKLDASDDGSGDVD